MKAIKTVAGILGILCIMMGVLWIGQGLGIIRWPASSFMIDVITWTWNGIALALVGGLLLWFARRR